MSRIAARNTHSSNQSEEQNENEFDNSLNSAHFPPPRTPLNTIPDPSQFCKETHESDFDSKEKLETVQAGNSRLSGRKIEAVDRTGGYATPRVLMRTGKPHSEPNSLQNTPLRSGSRPSLGGAMGAFAVGVRATHGKEASSAYRLSRRNSMEIPDFPVEAQHFELDDNHTFWADHNVQVLVRIRPLNNMERVSQGHGRCVRQESSQSLVWLGHPETRFTFDHIACETISQEKLFRAVGLPMVENCMSGYNSCMFAYGQTGSGKTYTMMGDINHQEGKFGADCGITPRTFEYLFSRIQMEEESRRNEKLRFSCKCSFLEIYNEQITDLLEPSSTNLQLREDLRRGVYVENLTECNVKTVDDVTKLISQGAANRKIAATNMNSESSRSHSVFTCIIESWWEKDSMTHYRFARLNLVDLAGSERQKNSGAEGERLKEAANINKSLSTLGLVIMSLVDLAHGKHRHVPYRDSRLTFLLQDSLGGNSKTAIIANISPSTCSALETLSTLKFAQRAKLIQNNATVNEDASGDVSALQRQIQLLKDQLSFLVKHHNLSPALCNSMPNFEKSSYPQLITSSSQTNFSDVNVMLEKNKCMEATLTSALRREKMAEVTVLKLEAEIDRVNQLASQREEEFQRIKMMLRFREEKIISLESLLDDSLPADRVLMEENKALKKEICLLQERIDKNPELTRFAAENLRLVEQIQLFQNYIEHGERERLLAEISELREQLLDLLETKSSQNQREQDNDILKELEECRNLNSKLLREVSELRGEMNKYSTCTQASVRSSFCKDDEEIKQANNFLSAKNVSTEGDSAAEMASYGLADGTDLKIVDNQKMNVSLANQLSGTQKELADARLLIEAMESEQDHLINKLQLLQEQNQKYMKLLKKSEKERVGNGCLGLQDSKKQNKDPMMENTEAAGSSDLRAKLEKLAKDLEQARSLNCQYQEDQASQLSQQHQIESIREQVEMETARTILHLQEEVCALQSEFDEKLSYMSQENVRLKNSLEAKEEKIKVLCNDWEKATFELTSFLLEGSKSLEDASGQIQSIVCSFPQPNALVRENVERAAQAFIDKEEAISQLEKSLKDARKMVSEMEMMLYSLKEAAIALNENPESHDYNNVGEINLGMLLNDNKDLIAMLESQLRSKEDHVTGTDHYKVSPCNDLETGIQISKVVSAFKKINHRILQIQNPECGLSMEDVEAQLDLENSVNTFYMDVERHVASFQTEMLEASTSFMEWVKDLVNEIQEMRSVLVELKQENGGFQFKAKPPTSKPLQIQEFENQLNILQPLREELAQINERLKRIEYLINENISKHGYLITDESSAVADSWNTDISSSSYSSSGCAFSSESAISGDQLDRLSYTCSSKSSAEINSPIVDLEHGSGSSVEAKPENSTTPMKTPCHEEAVTFCLRKELDMAFHSFSKLHAHLITNFYGNDIGDISYPGEMNGTAEPFWSRMQVAEASCSNTRKVDADHGINEASKFLGKFNEAQAVMREADQMLNAMLKENDNAKQLNDMWKQANEKLEKERSCLLEENMQLKACISSKEEGNELLLDKICRDLLEVAKSMSLFEEFFLQMQREVCDSYKEFYSQLLLMGREMLDIIVNSRSSVEDIFSEVMQKEFALSIFHQYVVGEAAHKIPSLNTQHGIGPFQPQLAMMNSMQKAHLCGQDDARSINQRFTEEKLITELEGGLSLSFENMMYENLSLKKKLERKEVLLKGLLFDLSLLQEAASDRKEIKDESENLILTLSRVRQELEMKTSQLDNLLVQYRKVEGHLADTENALSISLSDITQTKERIDELEDQNSELRMLLKDLYLTKAEAEEQLEEQKEVVRALEKEITHLTTSVESKVHSSVEGLEEELKMILNERDELRVEISSLKDKLEMAYALADENEAIAVESRQETEASRIYAEQKEEEVKILEHSVEELESTINVLEMKVYEMNDEVERHRMIRESLEVELEALRHRLMSVENFTDVGDSGNRSLVAKEDPITRQLRGKLLELHDQIKHLERDITEKDEEINQCKEYISELVVHSEAQASQFQDKYKTLEAMVHEVNTNMPNSSSATATLDKRDKSSVRTRGSGSPFRCISNIVQQMNLEKDQELSVARLRIEELEAALASRQKEVCMLNARLAAAESMTHDVIRDLLGVKFDMTNYADLIDELQVRKLVEAAQQQTEEFHSKEQEICNLRREISYLIEEKERCISEMNEKATGLLAAQVNMEQLQDRDRLLTAQNEMLKMDKSNLLKRVAELDEMIKTLFKTGSTQSQIQKTLKTKVDSDLTEKVARSENLLFRVNKELAEYHKSIGNHPNARINGNRRQNP